MGSRTLGCTMRLAWCAAAVARAPSVRPPGALDVECLAVDERDTHVAAAKLKAAGPRGAKAADEQPIAHAPRRLRPSNGRTSEVLTRRDARLHAKGASRPGSRKCSRRSSAALVRAALRGDACFAGGA